MPASPTRGGMTEKQRMFAEEVAQGVNPTRAARNVGYSHPESEAYRLMRHQQVLRYLHERRTAHIKGDMAATALRTMQDLMTSGDTPASVRYQASNRILQLAGHTAPSDGPGSSEKQLTEMTSEELAQTIQNGMQALGELAQQLEGGHIVDGEVRELTVIENDSQDDESFLE